MGRDEQEPKFEGYVRLSWERNPPLGWFLFTIGTVGLLATLPEVQSWVGCDLQMFVENLTCLRLALVGLGLLGAAKAMLGTEVEGKMSK